MTRTAWLLVPVGALAFCLGRLTVVSAPAPLPEAPVAARVAPIAPVVRPQVGLDREEVRAILREELAASAPAPAPVAAQPASPGTEGAERAIAAGLADGVWSDDDRTALRSAMNGLTQAEADAVMQQLLPALSSGQVRVESGSPI